MMRAWLSICSLAVAVMIVGCEKKGGGGGGGGGGEKPKVAVSIFPLWDVTRRIAGDRLDVVLVLPAGKSEHAYDPTPKEVMRLSGTKLGIAVGLQMDTWVEKIMDSAGKPRVVRLGEKVQTIPIDVEPIGEHEAHEEHEEHEEHGHDDHGHGKKDDHDDHGHDDHDDHDDDHGSGSGSGSGSSSGSGAGDGHHHAEVGAPDPHFWMDPDRMVGVVDVIVGELSAIDPEGAKVFAANGDAVKTALETIDAAIAARAKAWTKRTIVTFHGSMAYYAKRYDIRIAAVVEPVAGKEPTAAYIGDVIAAIKRGKAAALFSEPQLDKAPAETIAREAGIALGELDPVGGVAGRDSYELLLTWNTDQLEKVLK
jgi:zinc transport system substrate-binding protein